MLLSTSLVNGSNIAQFIANQLVVDSTANTPANIVAGSYLMGNNVASGNFVTLQPVNSIPSNYSLTMPELPAVTSFVTIDSTGNIVGSLSCYSSTSTRLNNYVRRCCCSFWISPL